MARRQHSFAAPLSPHVIADGNGRKCGVFPLRDTARRHLSDISPVLRTSRNYNQPHRVPRQPEQTKLEQYSLARRKSRDPGPQTIVTLQTGIRIQIQIRVLIPIRIRIRIRTGPQSQRAWGFWRWRLLGRIKCINPIYACRAQTQPVPHCPGLTQREIRGKKRKYI